MLSPRSAAAAIPKTLLDPRDARGRRPPQVYAEGRALQPAHFQERVRPLHVLRGDVEPPIAEPRGPGGALQASLAETQLIALVAESSAVRSCTRFSNSAWAARNPASACRRPAKSLGTSNAASVRKTNARTLAATMKTRVCVALTRACARRSASRRRSSPSICLDRRAMRPCSSSPRAPVECHLPERNFSLTCLNHFTRERPAFGDQWLQRGEPLLLNRAVEGQRTDFLQDRTR